MSSIRSALVLASLSILAVPTRAQGPKLVPVEPPRRTLELDLATGTVRRAPAVCEKSSGTTIDFYNMDLAGFSGIDTGGQFVEWFDAGTKGFAGNTSDLMSNITFAYCSSAITPGSGGPGAIVRLSFYEGYTTGGGTPTTNVFVLTIPGLPASDGTGALRCTTLRADLGELVPFADGPIGYAWRFMDQDAMNPILAATGPYLACVQSCSGAGPDGQGMVNQIDVWAPLGTLRSSLSLGTVVTATSMALAIAEATDLVGTVAPYVGDGINADVLSSGGAGLVLGHFWTASVTIGHPHGTSGTMSLSARASTVNGPNFNSPIGGRLTEVLISGELFFSLTAGHNGTSGTFSSQYVPLDLALVNRTWAAQASVVGGGFADLSLALQGVIGSI